MTTGHTVNCPGSVEDASSMCSGTKYPGNICALLLCTHIIYMGYSLLALVGLPDYIRVLGIFNNTGESWWSSLILLPMPLFLLELLLVRSSVFSGSVWVGVRWDYNQRWNYSPNPVSWYYYISSIHCASNLPFAYFKSMTCFIFFYFS